MAGIDISALAGTVGIPVDTFKGGIGAILNLLKQKLPADLFGQVHEKVPEASAMMESAGKAPDAPGGLAGAVGGMLGSAGGIAVLMNKLGALGLSVEQIKKFLPQALEFMKAYLPASLLSQVSAAVQKEG
jgi:hypothetical protein